MSLSTTADDILSVAYNNNPYYSYKKNGVVKGHAADVVRAVMSGAGVAYKFESLPWARLYQYALNKENQIVIGLTRTPHRESLFQWIGPTGKKKSINFYTLKSNSLSLHDVDEVKKYRGASLRGAGVNEYLIEHGYTIGENLYLVTEIDQLISMLWHGRVEYIVMAEYNEKTVKNKLGEEKLKVLFNVYSYPEYMAMSANSSPDLVVKIKSAYQLLEKDGKIELH